jgi:tetratricopeptide (TPR) repeat protein/DNA-binding CsgD family transcriptional regulator
MKKNQAGKSGNFKKLSIEIVKSIREKEGKTLSDLAKEIELNIGNEPASLKTELMGFIETVQKKSQFTKEEMEERIERHCKAFARYRLHEIRARAKLLLASFYLQTYVNFPECLQCIIEVELIAQKYLGNDNMVLCEALFVKGAVYYNQGQFTESSEAILQAQALKVFDTATPELHFKSNINLSRNYIFLNDYKNARKYLELAEQSWVAYRNDFDKVALYFRNADMLRMTNDWEGARDTLLECISFYKSTDITMRLAESYKEMGEFYGRLENPLKSFQQSMKYFTEAGILARKMKILRLECAIAHSIRVIAYNFEEWKLCAEYMIRYREISGQLHQEEIEIYIKKLEHVALIEKQKMIQQGKPTYTKVILDEVVQLREEHESLKKRHVELQKAISAIELLIVNKFHKRNQGVSTDQLYQMVAKGKTNQPSLESYMIECDKMHPEFSQLLLRLIPTITNMELKIAKLIKLGLTSQYIATLCGVTIKSIENHRMRLRKKCRLKAKESLSSYIISI